MASSAQSNILLTTVIAPKSYMIYSTIPRNSVMKDQVAIHIKKILKDFNETQPSPNVVYESCSIFSTEQSYGHPTLDSEHFLIATELQRFSNDTTFRDALLNGHKGVLLLIQVKTADAQREEKRDNQRMKEKHAVSKLQPRTSELQRTVSELDVRVSKLDVRVSKLDVRVSKLQDIVAKNGKVISLIIIRQDLDEAMDRIIGITDKSEDAILQDISSRGRLAGEDLLQQLQQSTGGALSLTALMMIFGRENVLDPTLETTIRQRASVAGLPLGLDFLVSTDISEEESKELCKVFQFCSDYDDSMGIPPSSFIRQLKSILHVSL